MTPFRLGLFAAVLSLSISAAAALSPGEQIIAAVLDHYADGTPDGRTCVMPTLEPAINGARGSGRKAYSEWLTLADESVAPSVVRMLEREFTNSTQGKTARITSAPRPLVLAIADAPTTGPCAIEGNEEEIWQLVLSRPAFTGNLAFVEVYAVADGRSPPPQLLALERRHGNWRPVYHAFRTLWYD